MCLELLAGSRAEDEETTREISQCPLSSFWHQPGALALPPPQLCDRGNSTHANFPQDQRPDACRATRWFHIHDLVDEDDRWFVSSLWLLLGHLL